jgi:transposase
MEEYAKQDKSTRMMIYKMVVENFNTKYTDLLPEQKTLLKEFINNISNTVSLKEYVNNQIQNVKLELDVLTEKITDKKIQIKLSEVNNILNMIPKAENVSDDDILNLMNYYELLHELRAS